MSQRKNQSNGIDEKVLLSQLTIYRNEIWSITNSILSQRDKLFKTETYVRCQDPNNYCLDPNPELHEIVTIILNNASRLQKIFMVASQRKDEPESQYEFRKKRAELLRKRFLPKKGGDRELFKSSLRNSIEHFDERIDTLMNHLIEKNDDKLKGKLLIYNMTLNSTEIFQPWDLVFPVKVLVTSTLEYYMVNDNLEKECINLKKVFVEAEKIQIKLKQYVDKYFPNGASERLGPVGVYLPTQTE